MNPSVELTLDEKILSQWLGKCAEKKDRIEVKPANFLRATLHQALGEQDTSPYRDGDFLPPGWHWLYFLAAPPSGQLGQDGHAALGDFLPPVALPKRMWAGTRLKFHQPLVIGGDLIQTSVIKNIVRKSGRSGQLCFVTVNHKFFSGSVLQLEEDHDIVYRGESDASKQTDKQTGKRADKPTDSRHPTPLDDEDISVIIKPTTTLLFRYSALTFNSHRIHYDLDFCQRVEGYPGLVVHAPLLATLMLELARNYYSRRIPPHNFCAFNLTTVRPLFHDKPFTIHLKEHSDESGCMLWATNPAGKLAMSATLTLP